MPLRAPSGTAARRPVRFESVFPSIALYVLGPALAFISTLSWLRPGKLLGRGDIFPYIFLSPDQWLQRVWYAWDPKVGLGGPADFSTFIPLVLVSAAIRHFLSASELQHLYYGAMMALQFAGMAWLTQLVFPRQRLAAFLAAAFYCFNVSMFQVLPFPMFMFFLAYTPFMIGLLIKALGHSKSDVALAAFIFLSVFSGYLFVNPPTYLLFVISLAVVALVLILRDRSPLLTRLGRPLLAAAAVAAVNCYWMLPAYGAIFGKGHDQVAAQLDTTFLKFVDRRADMVNVFWLNPYWAWDFDMYYPFHAVYNNPGIILSRFVPAGLFFSALLNRSLNRRLVLFLTGAALGLMLLTTGMQPPFGAVGEFLYRHMPLYWLYREPTTKFPLVLIIVMAPVVGFQLATLIRVAAGRLRGGPLLARAVLIAVGIFALCLPAYPLVTGQLEGVRNYDGIIADSNEVQIPQYWWNLSSYLHRSDPAARVLLLPNDDFYQMSYLWGLYAADQDVMAEILKNPFVLLTNSSFSTYLTPSQNYVDFQNRFYQSVISGTPGSIGKFLSVEGVRYVVERNDIDDSGNNNRFIMRRADVTRLMHASKDLRFVRHFGLLDLYEVRPADYVPPVYLVHRDALGKPPRRIGVPHILRSHVRPVALANATPSRLALDVVDAKPKSALVYAESFNPNWKACVVQNGACGETLEHKKAYGFENAWVLPRSGNYRVRLFYRPQAKVSVGYVVSAVATALALIALIALWRRRSVRAPVAVPAEA